MEIAAGVSKPLARLLTALNIIVFAGVSAVADKRGRASAVADKHGLASAGGGADDLEKVAAC